MKRPQKEGPAGSVARVLIADDHAIVRRGMRHLIGETPGMEVTVEVASGGEVLDALHREDVALLDISLPEISGLELLRRWPVDGPPRIMLTMHAEYLAAAMERGALGYLLKEDAETEVVACLRAVLDGQRYLSPGLRAVERPSLEPLTAAERRVLRLVAEHRTSREIAEILKVRLRTVQNHRASVVAKLGLRGPGALLRFCIQHAHEF